MRAEAMRASRARLTFDATLAVLLGLSGCTTTSAEPAAAAAAAPATTADAAPAPVPLQTLDAARIMALRGAYLAATAGPAGARPSPKRPKLPERLARVAARCQATLTVRIPSPLDKRELAPSKDPRDYYSVAPYWEQEGGKSVRHDGRRRADADTAGDKRALGDAIRLAEDAALCATLTADPAPFAAVFDRVATTWFVSPETSLHPRFPYAQYRAEEPESGVGIIDLRQLTRFVDALVLLDASGLVGARTKAPLVAWLAELDRWLVDSKPGRRESARRNNHGTFYVALRLALARATQSPPERRATAAKLQSDAEALAKHQFAADGSQAEELARTRPVHYTLFNLEAWSWLIAGLKAAGADAGKLEAALRPGFAYLSDGKRFAALAARDASTDAKRRAADLPARLWALQCRAAPLGLMGAAASEPAAERKHDLRSLVCRQPD
jgi:hypothetical protein